MNSFYSRINSKESPILVFDGATGTSFQELELTAKDFGGIHLEGCNENLVLTSPLSVEKVHRNFLDAGCDIIETNTFGATSIVLDEYNLSSDSFRINKNAAEIASKIAKEYSTKTKPRFVAGSIGPTTKLPTLGHISFEKLRESYQEQIEGLISGGIDLLTIETCQDVLQIKSALQAANNAMASLNIFKPIMVSITMETNGRMLVGTDIASAVSILQPYNIDILGLNCATGPEQMKEHIKYLSEHSPFIISCIPNAGLPENIGGVAHYKLTSIELKMQLLHFIEDLGVQLIGGCCGTTSEHIRNLSELAKEFNNNKNRIRLNTNLKKRDVIPSCASIYDITPYLQDNSFLIVGERLNASGSKKVRSMLNEDDWNGLVSIAKSQQKENAHILDINVDFVGRDGISDMNELVGRIVTNVNLPLMIDSTDYEKMESGLKKAGGKSILNSTNYEDGPDRFIKVLQLAKDYAAGVVIGTIDEEGMARTSSKKLEIAKRAFIQSVEYGIKPYEIFYDPLALPISTGIEEDRKNGKETIEAIKSINKELPDTHIILGISNISFGLTPLARTTLNSVFLNEAIKNGLDSAIVSPTKILPLSKIDEHIKSICLDLIYDNRIFENGICTYDPLTELTTIFQTDNNQSLTNKSESLEELPIEERLKQHIIDGERINIEKNLEIALINYKPLEIINTFLLDGMKVVGDLFASGEMQLPFVLQSAETMKHAVSFLEPYMESEEGSSSSKGKLLIATVKGDVHDIGKNLVDIILTNNGYEVINLGIKQEINAIIEAQKKYNADCIAMSGLLVKSTAFMKSNLEAFNDAGITVPVILGGAALTPKFVSKDCGQVYSGTVIYGKDAFTDLRFMESYMIAKNNQEWKDSVGFLGEIPQGILISNSLLTESNNSQKSANKNNENIKNKQLKSLSNTSRSEHILQESKLIPPFIGNRILNLDELSLEEISKFLDKKALFSGQWQLKRSKKQSKDEYNAFISEKAEPILNKWIDLIENKQLVKPSAVYGYFPCGRVDNKLKIYNKSCEPLGEFIFPRQKSGKRYCIADYFNDLSSNIPTDVIAMQAVTMGECASKYSNELFTSNKYSDYLYFHGLSVQLAEALAEYVHSIIRKECGFDSEEPLNIKDLLNQEYRGCRFSFGYPACPNVADSRLQIEWLGAERIGLSIDESDQLHPEQSTTAIVSLHSQARYFSA
tara:strand:+ start:2531 stop:6112 length:3582 start_codon:yes stop_codon:yes gene_type:complete